jgi:D-serine deaminase-like pyridoxal phosphate-dependent protein
MNLMIFQTSKITGFTFACIYYFYFHYWPSLTVSNNMIERPVLLLDEDRCKRNIQRIAEKAALSSTALRPHFKTHQCHEIGRWFREYGVNGITVSSPEMAAYFAQDGWNDITIAFPFYPSMILKIKDLSETCTLRLFVNRTEDLDLINRTLPNPVRFYIETDAGYGRSGVRFDDLEKINDLIRHASTMDKCRFHGFYIHDGGTYKARGNDDILALIKPSMDALFDLKKEYPDARISLGDTPSASALSDFDGLDECSAGNLVFYDRMQVEIGSCKPDDVALFVKVPIAQLIEESDRAIVHGGAVHFSKDAISVDGTHIFGQRVEEYSRQQIKLAEDSFMTALSQEHGTLEGIKGLKDTDSVLIMPIHSCLTANLFKHYVTQGGRQMSKRILS